MSGVYIPNAFTPNNDSRNDVFKPLIFGNLVKYEFNVYNRWGQLVYETNSTDGRWDGDYKGEPAPSGVFVWYAKANMINGTQIEQKGNVTLVR